MNGISILNDEYGYGIKVYSECPIYNFLIKEECEINYPDEKETIKWNDLLNPTGFSPSWIKIYLAEMMSRKFHNVRLI